MESESQSHLKTDGCPVCGHHVPADAPMGLCPACLLEDGLTPRAAGEGPGEGPGVAPGCVGPYEVEGEIARGGMGVVYRARHRDLDREVALKMILSGARASAAERGRFRLEAAAAGGLRHPNIVAIHEVGEHEGQPWLAMDLVAGNDLDHWIRERVVAVPDAVGMVVKVARAVAHAHAGGVVHRDLKPRNILVDLAGEPHVTDFGLAKRVGGDAGLTLPGTVLGSPGFVAPEQVAGGDEADGPGVDVYALGAILFFLLTGRPPFRAATAVETLRQAVEREPVSPRLLNPELPVDLETVVLKCLDKDPARRYGTADALAEDLERWVSGRPVLARRSTVPERAVKWIRRNPVPAALGGLVVAVTAVGIAAFLLQAARTRDALRTARRHAVAEATARAPVLDAVRVLAHDGPVASVRFDRSGERVLTASDDGRARLWDAGSGTVLRTFTGHDGVVGDARFSSDETRILTLSFDPHFRLAHLSPGGSLLETSRIPRYADRTVRVWNVGTGEPEAVLEHPDQVVAAAFDAGGRRIVTAGWDGLGRVWDVGTGRTTAVLRGLDGDPLEAGFTPDGRRVFLTSSGYDYALRVDRSGGGGSTTTERAGDLVAFWDPESGERAGAFRNAGREFPFIGERRFSRCRVAFDPEGRYAVTAGQAPENTAIWDRTRRRLVTRLVGHTNEVTAVALSADGSRAVTGSVDQTARVWEVPSGRLLSVLEGHVDTVLWCEFDSSGGRVVTSGADGVARVWDAETGIGLAVLEGHGGRVVQARFSPDGFTVVTASEDGTARLWDSGTPEQFSRELKGHSGAVLDLAFSPDGGYLASGSWDGDARVWPVRNEEPVAVLRGYSDVRDEDVRREAAGDVVDVMFSPDGRRLATASLDSGIFSGSDPAAPPVEAKRIAPFAPVRIWEAPWGDGEPTRARDAVMPARGVVFSPDGTRLLAMVEARRTDTVRLRGWMRRGWSSRSHAAEDLELRIWDPATGDQRVVLGGHGGEGDVVAAAFDGSGRRVATVTREAVRIWDADTGERIGVRRERAHVQGVGFFGGGERLLAWGLTGAWVLDVSTAGDPAGLLVAEGSWSHGAVIGNAGNPLAVLAGRDGRVVVCDLGGGGVLRELRHPGGSLSGIAVDAEGGLLATYGGSGGLRVWDWGRGVLLRDLRGGRHPITCATFDPSGEWLATGSEDYTIRLWPTRALKANRAGEVRLNRRDAGASREAAAESANLAPLPPPREKALLEMEHSG